jgi:hypothetical protein
MAFIILGLYRNMGNAASAAKKAEGNVMRRRQDPQGPGGTLMRQGQRPPPSSNTMRSGKKTANKLLSFPTMNSGLQSTINALIEKDGGTSKNFVLLEFRNRIQRNEALMDQLKLFNRLILDPDDPEITAQKTKRKNFNNSRSVNQVGIWTGAEDKQFPAVALQSVVGRYPGLFRQFFRENGTAYDSLLRVASASNEYNFWKYDGSRNIRMNDRGEFDTIVLLCVISPNNDTTYDLDRDNLESRNTYNGNSLYEGLSSATDKTFRMLAYKAKSKDGDLSRLPVASVQGRAPASPPDSDGYTRPNPALLTRFRGDPSLNGVPKATTSVNQYDAAAQQRPMTHTEALEAGRQGAEAFSAQRNSAKHPPVESLFSVGPEEPNKEAEIRAVAAQKAAIAITAALGHSGSAEEAAKEALKQVKNAIILNNLPDMQGQQGAAVKAAVKAAEAYNTAKTALEAAKAGGENTAAAEEAVEEAGLAMNSIQRLLPRPKGGSRRTKKRKIERTRRRNKKYGR